MRRECGVGARATNGPPIWKVGKVGKVGQPLVFLALFVRILFWRSTSGVRESLSRLEAALCLDGSYIRHLGFSWEEDATLLYKLTSPAHLQESLYRFGEAWSIEGSFVLYRGFSKEEDSTLLYKLTSPAHVSQGFGRVCISLREPCVN